jgi:hypothetical protein
MPGKEDRTGNRGREGGMGPYDTSRAVDGTFSFLFGDCEMSAGGAGIGEWGCGWVGVMLCVTLHLKDRPGLTFETSMHASRHLFFMPQASTSSTIYHSETGVYLSAGTNNSCKAVQRGSRANRCIDSDPGSPGRKRTRLCIPSTLLSSSAQTFQIILQPICLNRVDTVYPHDDDVVV